MADVYAIFGTLLALGIAFPGMLVTWWLLFPNTVEQAALRAERSPGRSLLAGIPILVGIVIPIMVLFSIPVPFSKFMGAILLFSALGFAGIGAAGIALKMSRQLKGHSSNTMSEGGTFIRAVLALELAAAFPFIGWFVVIPMTITTSLGVTVYAVTHRKSIQVPAPSQVINSNIESIIT